MITIPLNEDTRVTTSSVCIAGEAGTGKTVLAQRIVEATCPDVLYVASPTDSFDNLAPEVHVPSVLGAVGVMETLDAVYQHLPHHEGTCLVVFDGSDLVHLSDKYRDRFHRLLLEGPSAGVHSIITTIHPVKLLPSSQFQTYLTLQPFHDDGPRVRIDDEQGTRTVPLRLPDSTLYPYPKTGVWA